MIINSDKFIGLRVVTQSGQVVGRVHNIEFDIDTLKIINILVSQSNILDKILDHDLVISINSIIKITKKEVLIEDGLINILETSSPVISA